MPIRWSALKVSEAMNRVDALLNEAEPILEKAGQIILDAERIPNLPDYMLQRLGGVRFELERAIQAPRHRVTAVRKSIPDGAVEAERDQLKAGRQENLGL